MEKLLITETKKTNTEFGEGFYYLYDLLSHLTSVRQLFVHKLNILLQLSGNIKKSTFSRSEIEAMFPQYFPKDLHSILNSLLDGRWLLREEGTQNYSLSKPGLLFIRFLPFLYKGDQMDEASFQLALEQIFQVAETMNLDIKSIEYLRDQAIHSLQRSIDEIKSALVSKNSQRICEVSKKMSEFLKVIDNFILRLKELNSKKRELNMQFTNSDKLSISILLSTKKQIIELLDARKKYLMETSLLGDNIFTKQDVERFLYKQDFCSLSALFDEEEIMYVPSNAKWIDENDIVSALNIFLSLRKKIKDRKISQKIEDCELEKFDVGEDPYLIKVEDSLTEEFTNKKNLDIGEFILNQNNKTDILMYLASICFLEGQHIFSQRNQVSAKFFLDISKESEEYENKILKKISKGKIVRSGENE
jgi:hypothetical protein